MSIAVESDKRQSLSDFIRTRRSEIVAEWTNRVRSLSPVRELSDAAIVDHLPQILERVSEMLDATRTGLRVSLDDLPNLHAVNRLGRGFDLDQIVTEFSILRRSILTRWVNEVSNTIEVEELRRLDDAFDESISLSAERYAHGRERLLRALDRVSEAALGSADLDVFLQQLVRVMLDGTESVDTCVVLLREGDVLRVRAAVGLEEDLRAGFSLRIGEGFAGHVAAERRPDFLRHAAEDRRIKSDAIRRRGVRALYAVPLMREEKVIGVAHIGSLTAFEFSEEDKLLFRTMVSRATSGVVKAQILADLRRAETAQRFLAEASRHLAESLDYEATLAKIAHLAVPMVADWCVVDLVDADGIMRRVSVAHADRAKEKLTTALDREHPLDPAASTGIPGVLRTGVTEWRSDIADADLDSVARGPAHLVMLRELGVKSYIIAPIRARGEVVGTIALVTAESRRRYSDADVRLAEELARRASTAIDNARLYAEAQQAVAVRDRVLAIVSHDLRNHLGVIGTGSRLLARKARGLPEAKELTKPIETIQRVTDSMQHLVGDLVDLASLQAGKLSLDLRPVAIDPLLDEAFHGHELIADAKGVRLTTHLAAHDVAVNADRDRILQALANLLGNAIKFTPSGGAVVIRSHSADNEVQVAVSDTGPGIPDAELDAIFEPYRSIQRQGQSGAGLGLYIAKGIVERHGGRLWVVSQVGEGSTFVFTLPRA